VNDPTVFRRDCFKSNCATTLFNQRDRALDALADALQPITAAADHRTTAVKAGSLHE
jgi:hypothetical protein